MIVALAYLFPWYKGLVPKAVGVAPTRKRGLFPFDQPSNNRWTKDMEDHSELDSRYFIDDTVYNCPFCNRRNVVYRNLGLDAFDWSKTKRCFVWSVQCSSCDKTSMHLTFEDIRHQHLSSEFRPSPKGRSRTRWAGRWPKSQPAQLLVPRRRLGHRDLRRLRSSIRRRIHGSEPHRTSSGSTYGTAIPGSRLWR